MATPASRAVRAGLLQRLRESPPQPGVYLFRDAEGVIIYVGKSVCLRDRVRSYFRGRPANAKLRRLRREVRAVDWIVTGSELEALLLESRLVKQNLPRFNVMLRSFRPGAYVRIDWRDPFPRLETTRQPRSDEAEYFGPFGRHNAVEAAVRALANALGLRDCEIPGARLAGCRPCYRSELGTCAAPCSGGIDAEVYGQLVRTAADAFAMQGASPLRLLEERMERAAEQTRFEAAAQLRDAIESVRAAGGRHQALRSAVGRLNLLAACPALKEDSLVLFLFRRGRLVAQREVIRSSLRTARAAGVVVRALLAGQEAVAGGDEISLSPQALDEVQIVSAWMRRRTREGRHLQLSAPAVGVAERRRMATWLSGVAASLPRNGVPARSG